MFLTFQLSQTGGSGLFYLLLEGPFLLLETEMLTLQLILCVLDGSCDFSGLGFVIFKLGLMKSPFLSWLLFLQSFLQLA